MKRKRLVVEEQDLSIPFATACSNGQIEVARWLRNKGADIWFISEKGRIGALHDAAELARAAGNRDVYKWLYECFLDHLGEGTVTEEWFIGVPLLVACSNGHLEIAKWIINESRAMWEGDANGTLETLAYALTMAVNSSSCPVSPRWLIKAIKNHVPDQKRYVFETALFYMNEEQRKRYSHLRRRN